MATRSNFGKMYPSIFNASNPQGCPSWRSMDLGQFIRELFAVSISNALLTVHTQPRAILRICRKTSVSFWLVGMRWTKGSCAQLDNITALRGKPNATKYLFSDSG